jgi:hypothetical protein
MTTLADVAATLADGIESAVSGWVVRAVTVRVEQATGAPPAPGVLVAAEEAGLRARDDVAGRVRALLTADIDEQAGNPLAILRDAVRYPTEVLRAAGIPPVERDRFQEEAFPDDDYDLSPATFAHLDPALGDIGIAWGAATAWEHKRRHGGPA